MTAKIFVLICFLSARKFIRSEDPFDCDNDDFSALYGPNDKFIKIGNPEIKLMVNKYYNHDELTDLLYRLEHTFADILKVTIIGKTAVDKKDIFAVEISQGVRQARRLMKPMFKYMANIHGDEAVGYALMVFLIQYLVYNYGVKSEITSLLDTTDIWIVPTINPDGFKRSREGNCGNRWFDEGRPNGNGVSLNGNFPYNSTFKNTVERHNIVLEPETEAIVKFIKDKPFVLSGSIHGGAMMVVASYPYDGHYNEGFNFYMREPPLSESRVYRRLAYDYAYKNKMMATYDIYTNNKITEGNFWCKTPGSMQYYNNINTNCYEITLSLSCCKYPGSSELPMYWMYNYESLLKFIENTRRGFYGLVTDELKNPLVGAKVTIKGIDKAIIVTQRGEYWRLLYPGSYVIEVSAEGYNTERKSMKVTSESPYVRLDFVLKRK